MEVMAVQIPVDADKREINDWLSFLPLDRQQQIRRYVRPKDAWRSLCGDLISRFMLSRTLNVPFDSLRFDRNQYGKPFLRWEPYFDFNVSHSGAWVVCATGDNRIGADIEQHGQLNMEVARRFFAKEEYRVLSAKKGAEKLHYFYDLWTLKESYVKALGQGLSVPLDQFQVHKEGSRIHFESEIWPKYTFKQYDIDQGYTCSVCTLLSVQSETIQRLSFADFEALLQAW